MPEEAKAALREIIEMEQERKLQGFGPVQHGIQFAAEGRPLAEFVSEGYLPIPATGQRIEIHGVPVLVTDVSVAYETTEDGAPAVYASVTVEPVDA
ncbi:hypothetical protein GCM10009837_08010 [Streptomyces durmitorensis]|uniref:Uncharacterized protein n=1 Tax=Streptomyces durmitorensis TaxID=319947 RepID=A0ABY4PL27_9ACTN|nr:hypothetical protein [Streptomyces durmitorensis]UQT54311.1 hypothetical protein M4V62_04010 [Streptomyces durmitorensis]